MKDFVDKNEWYDRYHFKRFLGNITKGKSTNFIVELENDKEEPNIDIQFSAYTPDEEMKLLRTYDVELKQNLKITKLYPNYRLLIQFDKFKTLENFSDNEKKLFVYLLPYVKKIAIINILDLSTDDLLKYYQEMEIENPMSHKKEIRKCYNIPIKKYKFYDYDFR